MSTHAAPAVADPLVDPIGWVWDTFVHALAVFVSALLLGGALYYVWAPLAGTFSFLNPIDGFWNCTLVVLGAYAAYMVIMAARDGIRVNLFDIFSSKNRAGMLEAATGPAAVIVVAFVITEFLA